MSNQLAIKKRISSAESLKKIFNAQELISASRISKARKYAYNAMPYADAITKAVRAVSTHANIEHILTNSKRERKTSALLVLTSDRGMAGSYTSSIIRQANLQMEQLKADGKKVVLYICGRRGVSYYKFRGFEIAASWVGNSDAPSADRSQEVAKEIIAKFCAVGDDKSIDEVIIVCSKFVNMVVQEPRVIRMLPLELVESNMATRRDSLQKVAKINPEETLKPQTAQIEKKPLPLYEFEPSAEAVLDAILPRYVQSRIQECMLESAACETASRQRAMHTATQNASDLIELLVRKANQARQATITNELSEIVAGASALKEEN